MIWIYALQVKDILKGSEWVRTSEEGRRPSKVAQFHINETINTATGRF